MIPNYVRHASFRGLARYLVTGRGGRAPERVSWLSYRNIDSDMPWKVATAICESTVRSSKRRCKDPTLHFMWSPSPNDRPLSQKEWEAIADRTLKTMGLDGHQAIIVEHNDTNYKGKPRPHMHMMVNAVHEEGRAWRKKIGKPDPERKSYVTAPGDSFWKTRLDNLARQLERDYGLEQVDTPITAYWQNREWTKARSRKRVEQEIDKRTGRTPELPMHQDDVKTLGRQVKPLFLEATSWEDLQGRLNEEAGVSLKPKGQGLILQKPDGTYAKLSALGKMKLSGQDKSERLSKSRLARLYGEDWDDYWARASDHVVSNVQSLRANTSLTPPQRLQDVSADTAAVTSTDDDTRHVNRRPLAGSVEQHSLPPQRFPTTDRPFQEQQPPPMDFALSQEPSTSEEALPAMQRFEAKQSETYRNRMKAVVSSARTWARLEHIANQNGLRLHGGWAMHDGARFLDISILDGLDLQKRTSRYGESYRQYSSRSRNSYWKRREHHRRDRDFER